MKTLRDKYLQKIADYILKKVETTKLSDAYIWLSIGYWVNNFCISNFDLYLE